MKIAVLLGSPRKKDSYKVCQAVLQHLPNAEVDYIHLKDYRIEACKGCDQCFQKSESCCPCKDDLDLIKDKLLAADGIVFAAPVYAYQVPGPMKVAIDRLSYWFHRQALVGKPAMTVVTSAADFAFWQQKGWLESDYFFEVKLSPLKKLFSRCIKALIDWQVKKVTASSKHMLAVNGNCE